MNTNLKAFIGGFISGAKETPRGIFAPIIELFRWMNRVSDEAMRRK